MRSSVMEVVEFESNDNLSNLASALVYIESGEGSDRDDYKFKLARAKLINTIGIFHTNRFALGRTLAEYRGLYKQDQLWERAKEEIAKALSCSARTVSRIIEECKPALELPPFALEALEGRKIDAGKKRNRPIVEELLKCPVQESLEQARVDLERAVQKHASARNRNETTDPKSLEAFSRRMIRLFSGRFESQPSSDLVAELRYCLESVITALHADVGPLRCYNSLKEIPNPTRRSKKEPAAA